MPHGRMACAWNRPDRKGLYIAKCCGYDRAMLKTALTAACSFTLLATVYLSVSLIVLQPPRANVRQWFLMAALFAAAGTATLVALHVRSAGSAIRGLALAGGVAIVWVGANWAYATVTGPHFEGYAVVLGSALVAQGALTAVVLLPPLARVSFAAR